MQCSKICEHLTKALTVILQNNYNRTPYIQDGLILRLHFLHPGLVNCLFHIHLSALEWWCTDLKLGMIKVCFFLLVEACVARYIHVSLELYH